MPLPLLLAVLAQVSTRPAPVPPPAQAVKAPVAQVAKAAAAPLLRPVQSTVAKPRVLSSAAFAAAHPRLANTAARVSARAFPKHVQFDVRAGAGNFQAFKVTKATETEGVRDFGQLNQTSGDSTTKSVTVWAEGSATASLKSGGSGKASPFKLSFMEVRFVDTDGYTKPRSGGSGPWSKTVKAGDQVLVSVELATNKVPVGLYEDELVLDTPDKVFRVPLRVAVVMSVVSVKVSKIDTPALTMATGDQQSAKFTLHNTGNSVFHYEIVGSGGPSGFSISPVTGALSGGQSAPISVPVKAPATLAEPFSGSLTFQVRFQKGGIPVTQVVVGCSVETLWKTWSYQLKTLDGKVTQSATVAASSGGLWAWDFDLNDSSSLTPDGNEMAFCWDGSAGSSSLGFSFKCYTKPGQQSQFHFGGQDPALAPVWFSLGNAAVILNSWDTVTSDPFFKIIQAEMVGWFSAPLALAEYAANPIKDPTSAYSEWVAKHKLVRLKLGTAAAKP